MGMKKIEEDKGRLPYIRVVVLTSNHGEKSLFDTLIEKYIQSFSKKDVQPRQLHSQHPTKERKQLGQC